MRTRQTVPEPPLTSRSNRKRMVKLRNTQVKILIIITNTKITKVAVVRLPDSPPRQSTEVSANLMKTILVMCKKRRVKIHLPITAAMVGSLSTDTLPPQIKLQTRATGNSSTITKGDLPICPPIYSLSTKRPSKCWKT